MKTPIPFDGHNISEDVQTFLDRAHKLLINGEWINGVKGDSIETRDPATGLVLAEVAIGDKTDIDRAVNAARLAFDGAWSALSAYERGAYLTKLARLVEDNAETLAQIEVIDNGMPMMIAQMTVANCVEMLDYYAGAAPRIEGTTTIPPRHITAEAEALTYTVREAVGVAGQIIPWNVPLSMAILKLAPALAAGCTVVLKPSEETPLTALYLGQLILDAEFPAGVVNIVCGYGEKAGAAIAEHPDVDKVSFTGSTATGRKIVSAALGNLKKVSLELGGKSPVIVLPDADLELAVPGVAMATFFLQGQNCMAGTRIFIHESIHDAMVDGLVAFSKYLALGHGLNPENMIGPMISDAHCGKVMSYIERGVSENATLVTGGKRLERPGNFVEPTIFTNCNPQMAIVRDEIFGPVMAIQRFKTDDINAIASLANDTVFGLSGSVWTQRLDLAHRLVARIRAGHVSINCHGAVGTNIPFGGYGQSGWGREFGQDGVDGYLETKAVTARL